MYSPIEMPACGGVANDLVVHVGNVHHVAHLHAGQLQKAAQHVDLQESAKVADVAVVVDCRPAGVHAQRLAVRRDEFVQLSRKGIEKAEGHRSWSNCLLKNAIERLGGSSLFDCSSGGYGLVTGHIDGTRDHAAAYVSFGADAGIWRSGRHARNITEDDVLSVLCDPDTRYAFELDGNTLRNTATGRVYPIRDGIPFFVSTVTGPNLKYQGHV